jgi:hypothetical protein
MPSARGGVSMTRHTSVLRGSLPGPTYARFGRQSCPEPQVTFLSPGGSFMDPTAHPVTALIRV